MDFEVDDLRSNW